MVGHLGRNQLETLASTVGLGRAMVVGNRTSDRLVALGLMVAARQRDPAATDYSAKDGLVTITASGLRAVADAIDAGRIEAPVERVRQGIESRRAGKIGGGA